MIRLLNDDCKVRMATFEPDSIEAMVSDPPYYLTAVSRGGSARTAGTGPYGRHTLDTTVTPKGFMGKIWDGDGLAHSPEFWRIVYRIIKPGGVVKAFAGTRTYHRMAAAMEEAGFTEIGLEGWVYGSGFPKSLNVGKSIDRMKGLERETKQVPFSGNMLMRHGGDNTRPWMEEAAKTGFHELQGDEPACDESKLWDGWGTALKPAWEPVLVGWKPLS